MQALVSLSDSKAEHIEDVEITDVWEIKHGYGFFCNSMLHIGLDHTGHDVTMFVENDGAIKLRLVDEKGNCHEHILGYA